MSFRLGKWEMGKHLDVPLLYTNGKLNKTGAQSLGSSKFIYVNFKVQLPCEIIGTIYIYAKVL